MPEQFLQEISENGFRTLAHSHSDLTFPSTNPDWSKKKLKTEFK